VDDGQSKSRKASVDARIDVTSHACRFLSRLLFPGGREPNGNDDEGGGRGGEMGFSLAKRLSAKGACRPDGLQFSALAR